MSNPVNHVEVTFLAAAQKVTSQDYRIVRINMIFCGNASGTMFAISHSDLELNALIVRKEVKS